MPDPQRPKTIEDWESLPFGHITDWVDLPDSPHLSKPPDPSTFEKPGGFLQGTKDMASDLFNQVQSNAKKTTEQFKKGDYIGGIHTQLEPLMWPFEQVAQGVTNINQGKPFIEDQGPRFAEDQLLGVMGMPPKEFHEAYEQGDYPRIAGQTLSAFLLHNLHPSDIRGLSENARIQRLMSDETGSIKIGGPDDPTPPPQMEGGLPKITTPEKIQGETFTQFVARTMNGMTPDRFNMLPGEIRNGALKLFQESQQQSSPVPESPFGQTPSNIGPNEQTGRVAPFKREPQLGDQLPDFPRDRFGNRIPGTPPRTPEEVHAHYERTRDQFDSSNQYDMENMPGPDDPMWNAPPPPEYTAEMERQARLLKELENSTYRKPRPSNEYDRPQPLPEGQLEIPFSRGEADQPVDADARAREIQSIADKFKVPQGEMPIQQSMEGSMIDDEILNYLRNEDATPPEMKDLTAYQPSKIPTKVDMYHEAVRNLDERNAMGEVVDYEDELDNLNKQFGVIDTMSNETENATTATMDALNAGYAVIAKNSNQLSRMLKDGFTIAGEQGNDFVLDYPVGNSHRKGVPYKQSLLDRFIKDESGTFDPEGLWDELRKRFGRDPNDEELMLAMQNQSHENEPGDMPAEPPPQKLSVRDELRNRLQRDLENPPPPKPRTMEDAAQDLYDLSDDPRKTAPIPNTLINEIVERINNTTDTGKALRNVSDLRAFVDSATNPVQKAAFETLYQHALNQYYKAIKEGNKTTDSEYNQVVIDADTTFNQAEKLLNDGSTDDADNLISEAANKLKKSGFTDEAEELLKNWTNLIEDFPSTNKKPESGIVVKRNPDSRGAWGIYVNGELHEGYFSREGAERGAENLRREMDPNYKTPSDLQWEEDIKEMDETELKRRRDILEDREDYDNPDIGPAIKAINAELERRKESNPLTKSSLIKSDPMTTNYVENIQNMQVQPNQRSLNRYITEAQNLILKSMGSDLTAQEIQRFHQLASMIEDDPNLPEDIKHSFKFDQYRLPDGSVINVDATASKGLDQIEYRTKDGKTIMIKRVPRGPMH